MLSPRIGAASAIPPLWLENCFTFSVRDQLPGPEQSKVAAPRNGQQRNWVHHRAFPHTRSSQITLV